jgi:hypothetical protein
MTTMADQRRALFDRASELGKALLSPASAIEQAEREVGGAEVPPPGPPPLATPPAEPPEPPSSLLPPPPARASGLALAPLRALVNPFGVVRLLVGPDEAALLEGHDPGVAAAVAAGRERGSRATEERYRSAEQRFLKEDPAAVRLDRLEAELVRARANLAALAGKLAETEAAYKAGLGAAGADVSQLAARRGAVRGRHEAAVEIVADLERQVEATRADVAARLAGRQGAELQAALAEAAAARAALAAEIVEFLAARMARLAELEAAALVRPPAWPRP